MTPNEAGATVLIDAHLLDPDWHKNLTAVQRAAYIRFQFLWLHHNAPDWDHVPHTSIYRYWDGGVDPVGKKHSRVWAEIGRTVAHLNADPGMWVHAHFSPAAEIQLNPATQSLPVMRPAMLHSAKSPRIYKKYTHTHGDILWNNFELAGRTIRERYITSKSLGLPKEDQNIYVLCDENYVSATPFFRHAFAAAGECYPVVEEYLWLAALDYEVNQKIYDEVIARHGEPWWITDNLKMTVIQIRGHWEHYNG